MKISRSFLTRAVHTALFVALASAAIASATAAQDTGDGFLFAKPKGSLMVRAGYASATAKSDLFSFTTDQLTLDRRDFSGPSADVEIAIAWRPRTQVVLSGGVARARKGSEFRRFVDQDDNPIQQTTAFDRVPLTVGVRQYLTSPGRGIGNFAWVPAKFAPFLGVSAGAVWYRFVQEGDFIDFTDNEVFSSTLTSSGWSPAARALAGAEYSLTPRLMLTGQCNYLWARGRLSDDFSGFDRIDLSGYSTSIGLAVRF